MKSGADRERRARELASSGTHQGDASWPVGSKINPTRQHTDPDFEFEENEYLPEEYRRRIEKIYGV